MAPPANTETAAVSCRSKQRAAAGPQTVPKVLFPKSVSFYMYIPIGGWQRPHRNMPRHVHIICTVGSLSPTHYPCLFVHLPHKCFLLCPSFPSSSGKLNCKWLVDSHLSSDVTVPAQQKKIWFRHCYLLKGWGRQTWWCHWFWTSKKPDIYYMLLPHDRYRK